MKILAIDTASARCSAALWLDGTLTSSAVPTARDHARLLLPMIDALLGEAGIGLHTLDAIAFGRGPGSFTGLRIAASVAQGLALGAGLGVLPVSDLRALAEQGRRRSSGGAALRQVVACMDARMAEVYWACFPVEGDALATGNVIERVGPAAEVRLAAPGLRSAGAGAGFAAYPDLARQLQIEAAACYGDLEPDAGDVAGLAAADLGAGCPLLAPEEAQPVYLRDNVAITAKKPPL